jgi:hypothetical protein
MMATWALKPYHLTPTDYPDGLNWLFVLALTSFMVFRVAFPSLSSPPLA